MITITDCTPDDYAVVVALWNGRTLDQDSCWYQAPGATAQFVADLVAAGFVFHLAKAEGIGVGFGFWHVAHGVAWLNAFAGATAEVYYRLMRAFCAAALELGLTAGQAEIDVRSTHERGWLDALAAVSYSPVGYQPLMPGQDPTLRVAQTLRVDADLAQLAAAIALLGDSA